MIRQRVKKGTSVNTNIALYSIRGSLEIMSTVPSGNKNKNLVFDNLKEQIKFANPNIFCISIQLKAKLYNKVGCQLDALQCTEIVVS